MLVAALIWFAGGPGIGTASADDVQVNAYTTGDQRYPAVAVVQMIFTDGFESGDTSAWQ